MSFEPSPGGSVDEAKLAVIPPVKIFFVLLLVAGLGAIAWVFRDSEVVRHLIRPDAADTVRVDKNGHSTPADAGSARINRPESMGVHKCKQGSEIIYTTDACPEGSKQQSITAGAVTVMPVEKEASHPDPQKTAGQTTKTPTVRDLLAPADDASSRQRQSEKTIGK